MVFWTNYPKCFLATIISVIGGVFGLIAVVLVFEFFSTDPMAAILGGAAGIAGFFGLNRLADNVATRKYARMAENEKL